MNSVTRTLLDAKTIPLVAIDFMNNTHFEEIELVRQLGELILDYQMSDTPSDTKKDPINPLLNDWLAHTKAHFERENELMQQTGFPAYAVHSNEHEIALEKMTHVLKAWQSNQDIALLADYVFTHWPAWFNEHVNSMDRATATFAAMNGFTQTTDGPASINI